MDHNQFPERDEEDVLPQELTFSPPEDKAPPQEEMPVIEEIPVMEDIPLSHVPTQGSTEAPGPSDAPVWEEAPGAEETAPPEEMPPMEQEAAEAPSFMERIPDTDEDYPAPEEYVTVPEDGNCAPEEDYLQILEEAQALAGEAEPAAYPPNDAAPEQPLPTPEEEEPAPKKQRPARKGRPRRRKGEGLFGIPSILVTLVWLALIVFTGVTLGRMVWVCAADVLAFGREDKPVTVTIYEADTMEDITDKLYDAGLIRYKSLFSFYASISDAQEDIDPGIYDLNTRYDYHALVNMMSASSTREVVKVTIPEGYTCRQIFDLLQEYKVCTAVDLAAYAATGELDEYWFLENVERGSQYCLEGFLFPDTYEFYKNDSPRSILQKMLNNFSYRFNEEMRAQLDVLNANVTGGGYGIREVVIVASLIEKETAASSESARIAGVIYNRLFNWGSTPAFLNIDASIVYAQDGDNSRIDTSIDSPYNTYLYTGLTPTPIANPGLSSLQAALSPETHKYYYYVLNPSTGLHQFSSTYEEHQGNVSKFAAVSRAASEGE